MPDTKLCALSPLIPHPSVSFVWGRAGDTGQGQGVLLPCQPVSIFKCATASMKTRREGASFISSLFVALLCWIHTPTATRLGFECRPREVAVIAVVRVSGCI